MSARIFCWIYVFFLSITTQASLLSLPDDFGALVSSFNSSRPNDYSEHWSYSGYANARMIRSLKNSLKEHNIPSQWFDITFAIPERPRKSSEVIKTIKYNLLKQMARFPNRTSAYVIPDFDLLMDHEREAIEKMIQAGGFKGPHGEFQKTYKIIFITTQYDLLDVQLQRQTPPINKLKRSGFLCSQLFL